MSSKLTDHTGPITRDLCENKDLIFFPKTHEESKKIQQALFDMGYGWKAKGKVLLEETNAIKFGLVLFKRTIYSTSASDPDSYLVCTLAQFQPNYNAQTPAVEDIFNRFATRMDVLEARMGEIIQRLDDIAPRTIKPLKIKKDGM